MQRLEQTNWINPLIIAAQIPETEISWVLLYSGMQTSYSGRYSVLAMQKKTETTGSFTDLENKLQQNSYPNEENIFANSWFGYLGYGLKNELEKLTTDSPSFINTPDLWFAQFALIVVFDHEKQQVEVWGEPEAHNFWKKLKIEDCRLKIEDTANLQSGVFNLQSNMTKSQYLAKVNQIKEAIKCGDLYQANLTRKFFGEISSKTKPFDIFQKLCQISPAPYSAFIKTDNFCIISSSPERFLQIDQDGNANTRPIKGSSARKSDPLQDKISLENLKSSEKDRAENLMIVDLSRNDLARNCYAGSVKVDELFATETFATIHHMASSISGKKKSNTSSLELIKGCFPPGSMTGTPKIKAMELCSNLEQLKRGIYAGAIGWLGHDGSADLAVVIRTIILQGNKFEFQVGGAIVHDSDSGAEFNETMIKARGVAGALGIEIAKLEEL